MKELFQAVTAIGVVIWEAMAAKKSDEEVKAQARDELEVALDTALAKRRLRARKAKKGSSK
jgi:hypothetical protein